MSNYIHVPYKVLAMYSTYDIYHISAPKDIYSLRREVIILFYIFLHIRAYCVCFSVIFTYKRINEDVYILYTYIYIYKSIGLRCVGNNHYNDIIMRAMAYQITGVSIVYSTLGSGLNEKNIKAPRHWPMCGEFTGDRYIPHTKGQ